MKKLISVLLTALLIFGALFTSAASNEALTFLSAVNNAQTAVQIRTLLEARSDLEFDLSGIYYKDNIYGGLVGQNFASMTELNNCALGLLVAEEAEPKVALYNGNSQVVSPSIGDHRVIVAPLLRDGVKIVAATYKGGVLNTYDIKDGSATETTELSLGNMTGTETSKVIFLENFSSLKPLNSFELFYDDKIEIYVSSNSTASGDGSSSNPFGSIAEAQEYVRTINSDMTCDIRVNILPGTYYITEPIEFTEADSGTNGYEVIWSGAYGDSLPVISGGVPVSGWESIGGGLYKAHAENVTEARQFYVDGTPAQRAISNGYYIAEKPYGSRVLHQVNYEFENYASKNVFDEEAASGGKVVASGWTTSDPSMEFSIEIPADGYYDISYILGYCSYEGSFSKVHLTLDGESIGNNLSSGEALSGYADTYGNINFPEAVHKYTKKQINLTEGTHTVGVSADLVSGGTWYTYLMDNITFTSYCTDEVKYSKSDTAPIQLEFEDYASNFVRDDEAASGGKVVAHPWTTTNPGFEFTFNVPVGGYYDASYIIGYQSNPGSYSKISLYIDDTLLGDNTTSGTALSGYANSYGGVSYNQPIHQYSKKQFWLKPGEHTVKVRGEVVTGGYWYTYLLDHLTFTPTEIEQGFYLSGYDLPAFSHPEDLELVVPVLWSQHRLPVRDVIPLADEDRYIFAMDMPYYYSYINMAAEGEIQPTVGTWFYIENALEFLDKPGEFYFDKETRDIYYYPHNQEELTKEAYIPISEGLISIKGSSAASKVSNLRFTGLDFRHGAYNELTDTGLANFQADCMMPHNAPGTGPSGSGYTTPSQIHIDYADGIIIENCRMSNLGSAAVGMIRGVTNSRLKNNVIHDISATAYIVGSWRYKSTDPAGELCSNINITDNYIRRIGQEIMCTPAIGVYYAKNVDISYNDISDTPYTAITVGWGWGANLPVSLGCGGHRVVGNRINANSRIMRDGGAIYTNGSFAESGVYIAENYITDSPDFAVIYMDTGSSHITIEKNVVENVIGSGTYNWTRGNPSDSTLSGNYVMNSKNALTDSSIALNTTVVSDGNWTGEAKTIADNAGLSTGLRGVTTCDPRPQIRGTVYDYMPPDEIMGDNDILLECENHNPTAGVGYFAGSANGSYLEPAIYTRGKYRKILGNFAETMWYKYDFTVPVAGRYRVELRYSTGKNSQTDTVCGYATISTTRRNGSNLTGIPLMGTASYYVSQPSVRLGELSLPAGSNTLQLLNAGGSWSFDNIKLIYIGD